MSPPVAYIFIGYIILQSDTEMHASLLPKNAMNCLYKNLSYISHFDPLLMWQRRFLNKALLRFPDSSKQGSKIYTISDVEEAKAVLRLVPIWATSLVYAIVYAQCSTFFTKQGATMERTIFPGFDIPAASLQSLIGRAMVVIIPIYDLLFVPIARAFIGKPSGITMLQRIGTGMLLSVICMVALN